MIQYNKHLLSNYSMQNNVRDCCVMLKKKKKTLQELFSRTDVLSIFFFLLQNTWQVYMWEYPDFEKY